MRTIKFFLLLGVFLLLGYQSFISPKLNSMSKNGKINRWIVLVIFSIGLSFFGVISFSGSEVDLVEETVVQAEEESDAVKVPYIKLDVPLINQMEDPQLHNGCEVTSLAMLLNYYGIKVSKNELGEKIPKEIYQNEKGIYGDPNEGFVGDIEGGKGIKGYGVYVGPILKLAEDNVSKEFEVKDLTKKSVDDLLMELSNGHPIWCIVTVPLKATNDNEIWMTKNGEVEISWNIHSVVLTGFDSQFIFVNDPYGEQKSVAYEDFKSSWEQMGSQAMTIQLKDM